VVGRKSAKSLYSLEHVTFEEDTVYDQRDAQGFIKLNALRLRLLHKQRV
jgi:argininosuccinate synthase